MTEVATTTAMAGSTSGPIPLPTSVIVHPLVLLSATDHYMRVAKDTSKRVVGVLLGAKEIVGDRDTLRIASHEGQVDSRSIRHNVNGPLHGGCSLSRRGGKSSQNLKSGEGGGVVGSPFRPSLPAGWERPQMAYGLE